MKKLLFIALLTLASCGRDVPEVNPDQAIEIVGKEITIKGHAKIKGDAATVRAILKGDIKLLETMHAK